MTVKVLYVLSSGHSGSTLLGNALGEMAGFFHAGELRLIWRMGLLGDSRCGCGRLIRECPVWTSVVNDVFTAPPLEGAGPEDVVRWQDRAVRSTDTERLLRLQAGTGLPDVDLERYVEVVSRLYRAIGNETGSSVVIDSTKRQDNAALLPVVPDVDPYLVHLVRDPRAVVNSWDRRKRREGSGAGLTTPSLRGWISRNRAAESVRRRFGSRRTIRVRYEDFVADPRSTMEAVAALVSEPQATLPLVDERTVRLTRNHTAGGNRMRFTIGDVELREDRGWVAEQGRGHRWLTTALALPMLGRYGYRIDPSRTRPGPTPTNAGATHGD